MSTPTRRGLLAAIGAASVAGCIDAVGLRGDPPDSLGAPEPDACPTYGDRVDRVVCYDEVDAGGADVVLEPDRATVADGESIAFTLENGTSHRLETNFYGWRVDKRVDDEWHHVAPREVPQPLMDLDPGASHTWTVTIDRSGPEGDEPLDPASGTEDLTLPAVGAGTYAFRARGWFEDDSHEEAIAFAATFDVEGDRLELSPSDAIATTEWDDGVLVAESTRGDPDGEHHRRGAFDLERVSATDETSDDDSGEGAETDDASGEADADRDGTESVIAEQLFRRPQLRDAIALAREHDADRVRLEEYDATYPVFGSRSDGVYEYRGESYRVETRELEE